ncbi:Zinc metalloproteinase nas-13-like 2 [Homarus americanus]|uniref:Metalloendopeptidase n=1 Tax=Homarus americanus TaxID=6706 RepID=A0A8J5MJH4_HOMAM|nr:Zinc metalloproteinase nas-13-like 2 [Homarus americanus]
MLITMLRWYCLTWVMVVGSKDITALIRSSDPNVQILGQPQLDPNFLPEVAMGNPDTVVHAAVDTSHQADPIELAGLYQGDIILNSMDEYSLSDMSFMGRGRSAFPNPRNAIIKMTRRWPNGVIPYVISSSYNSHERGTIAMAIKKYHDTTCIRLVPRTIERDYIHILKGDGCSSSVGRIGGAQVVSLGPGCLYVGIVMHELMHAAGFWHEQSRADRDNFITVNKMNVQSGMWYNFEKYPWERIQSLGVEYDLGSVMHYGPYAFARDRTRPTIIPRKTGVEIGQRRGFSEVDICEDNNDHCNAWVDLGECEKNPIWMNVNCRKACKQCGKKCRDNSPYCSFWAQAGECTANASYMTIFCKLSCVLCDDAERKRVYPNDNERSSLACQRPALPK